VLLPGFAFDSDFPASLGNVGTASPVRKRRRLTDLGILMFAKKTISALLDFASRGSRVLAVGREGLDHAWVVREGERKPVSVVARRRHRYSIREIGREIVEAVCLSPCWVWEAEVHRL
jgi:hypothetical protein